MGRSCRLRRWPGALLASVFAVSVMSSAALPLAALAVEPIVVTAHVGDSDIKVYLYKPDGRGPFPLMILSHGSPRLAADRANYGPHTMRLQAQSYAASGVAVAVPIRRGYGGSGEWAEAYGTCNHADYFHAGLESARDIEAAIRAVEHEPGVDASRVALMGVSAGGWASVAAGSKSRVMGVVSFAGGRGSSGPDAVCSEDQLIEAMSRYGRSSPAPELWIYSQNDHFFGPELSQRMFRAFANAGGKVQFIRASAYRDDGHAYIQDIAGWKPEVDAFLKRIGFLR